MLWLLTEIYYSKCFSIAMGKHLSEWPWNSWLLKPVLIQLCDTILSIKSLIHPRPTSISDRICVACGMLGMRQENCLHHFLNMTFILNLHQLCKWPSALQLAKMAISSATCHLLPNWPSAPQMAIRSTNCHHLLNLPSAPQPAIVSVTCHLLHNLPSAAQVVISSASCHQLHSLISSSFSWRKR